MIMETQKNKQIEESDMICTCYRWNPI